MKTVPQLFHYLLDKQVVIVFFVFIAFAWAILIPLLLFPFYSNNHDEPIYILQAQALAQGRLVLPRPPHEEFFKIWFVADGGIIKYTPVHAAFLALGLKLFGSMRAALGWVAVGNVLLLYRLSRELYRSKRVAATTVIFFLCSPFFLIQSATFLAYTSTLLLHLTFALLWLRGGRRHAPHLLVGAGLALGLAFFSRPYDALLFAAPFGMSFIQESRLKLGLLKLRGFFWFLLGLTPLLALVLFYNYFVTGQPLRFPFTLWDAQDTLGFGRRGQQAVLYSLPAAIEALGHSLWQLNLWVGGGSILLILALAQFVWRQPYQREIAWLGILFIFPAGYFFFWGSYVMAVRWDGAEYLGPFYYLPVLIPLAMLGARGLLTLFQHRCRAALGLTVLMVIVNGGLVAYHLAQNYAYTQENRAIYRPFTEQKLDNALVFVPPLYGPFLLHPFAYLGNTPTLDGPILYAVNRGRHNFALVAAYPERTAYYFEYDGSYTEAPNDQFRTVLVKLERFQGERFSQPLRLVNPTDSPYVYAEIKNGRQAETYLLDASSRRGQIYDIEWNITPHKIEFRGPYQQHLSAITILSPNHQLVLAAAFSDTSERSTQQIFERRYIFQLTKDNRLDILLPPEEWHNSFWPLSVWRMEDITEVMLNR